MHVMGRCVGCVVEDANAGCLGDDERWVLLDALDAVPRDHAVHEREWGNAHFDDWKMERGWRLEAEADVGHLVTRAERAERERDELRADNDRLREALDRCCTCVGKGTCHVCRTRAALSADADADAEPSRYDPQNCTHKCNGPRDCTGTPTGCRWCGCSRCDVPPGEEPSRAEGGEQHTHKPEPMDPNTCTRCGEDRLHAAHPPDAEGDEQPQSLNDLAREWGLPPLTWVHTRFIEPHEPSPDSNRAYTQPGTGRLEAPCLNCGNGEVVMAIPNYADGGRS